MQVEHIGEVISRTINGSGAHPNESFETRLGQSLHGQPRTLPELMRAFELQESRENPDVTAPLDTLRLTDRGYIHIPNCGAFAFTDWSRHQCAGLLGIRWDKWFQNADAAERAHEMNRRFARAQGQVRLRTMKPGEEWDREETGADGILRAFVSPSYAVVKDSRIAHFLMTALSAVEHGFELIRYDVTDRSTSFVVAVGKPYRVGSSSGKVGDVWGGVLVRNSGVGFASLIVILHLTRLLCLNGMTAPLPDAVLVRRRHRGFQEATLFDGMRLRAAELPGALGRGVERLALAEGLSVDNIERAVRELLENARLPQHHVPAILAAYEREPLPSALGVSQAVTLAAQSVSPEERLELERAAGAYLVAQA